MKDYEQTIQTLRAQEKLFFKSGGLWTAKYAKEAADAIEELIEEVKRLTAENEKLRSWILKLTDKGEPISEEERYSCWGDPHKLRLAFEALDQRKLDIEQMRQYLTKQEN